MSVLEWSWTNHLTGKTTHPKDCSKLSTRDQTLLWKLIKYLENSRFKDVTGPAKHNRKGQQYSNAKCEEITEFITGLQNYYGKAGPREILAALEFSENSPGRSNDYLRWVKLFYWDFKIDPKWFDKNEKDIVTRDGHFPNIIDIKSFVDPSSAKSAKLSEYSNYTIPHILSSSENIIVFDYMGRYPLLEWKYQSEYIESHKQIFSTIQEHVERSKFQLTYSRFFGLPVTSKGEDKKNFIERIKLFLRRCPEHLFRHICWFLKFDKRFTKQDPEEKLAKLFNPMCGFYFLSNSPIARHWGIVDKTLITDYFWYDYKLKNDGQDSGYTITLPETLIVEKIWPGTTEEIVRSCDNIIAQQRTNENKLYRVETLVRSVDELFNELVSEYNELLKRKPKSPKLAELGTMITLLQSRRNIIDELGLRDLQNQD